MRGRSETWSVECEAGYGLRFGVRVRARRLRSGVAGTSSMDHPCARAAETQSLRTAAISMVSPAYELLFFPRRLSCCTPERWFATGWAGSDTAGNLLN